MRDEMRERNYLLCYRVWCLSGRPIKFFFFVFSVLSVFLFVFGCLTRVDDRVEKKCFTLKMMQKKKKKKR